MNKIGNGPKLGPLGEGQPTPSGGSPPGGAAAQGGGAQVGATPGKTFPSPLAYI